MRRYYLLLLSAICILVIGTIHYCVYRQRLYQAESLLAGRLGIEPRLDVVDQYLVDQFRLGRTKEEVFKLLDTVEPDTIKKTGRFSTQTAETQCYHVTFDATLHGIGYLNRFLCFDGDGVLIYVEREPQYR